MNKKLLVLCTIILIVISIISIFIFGNNYNYKIYYFDDFNKEDIKISYENPDIVECKEITYENNVINIDFEAKNKGVTEVNITVGESEYHTKVFVHYFNIITEGSYIGNFTGVYLFEVEFAIFLILLLGYCIKDIKMEAKKISYSYIIINKFGIIIFILFNLIRVLLNLLSSKYIDLANFYGNIINSFSVFAVIGFPIVFIFSIYLIISNIALVKNEGKSLTNFLGIILGIFLILGTNISYYIYNLLSIIMETSSYLGYHISQFIETSSFVILCYFECLMCSTMICTVKAGNYKPNYDKDFVIILGSGIRKDGTLTPLLAGRVDKAIEFAKNQERETNKEIIFVPSGGQGNDEIIAEAEAMKNYLISQGIEEKYIIVENKSTNTLENMKFSKQLIEKNKENSKVIFSTTNYHVFRSGVIANLAGMKCEGIGSKTKWYFYINALIREFIADLNIQRKKHILNITLIIFAVLVLILFSYYGNIL